MNARRAFNLSLVLSLTLSLVNAQSDKESYRGQRLPRQLGK